MLYMFSLFSFLISYNINLSLKNSVPFSFLGKCLTFLMIRCRLCSPSWDITQVTICPSQRTGDMMDSSVPHRWCYSDTWRGAHWWGSLSEQPTPRRWSGEGFPGGALGSQHAFAAACPSLSFILIGMDSYIPMFSNSLKLINRLLKWSFCTCSIFKISIKNVYVHPF